MIPPGEDLLPRAAVVYLVEEQPNPSTDYFVRAACEGSGRELRRRGFEAVPPLEELEGAVVVFVRYLPVRWRRAVEQVRSRLAALVFFMDDDVLDTAATAGLPWRYRYKLHALAGAHQRWLREQGARMWVSTKWLQEKYAHWSPQRVQPRLAPPALQPCRVFYHGTASHGAEIAWLLPVMQEVLQRDARISFEIVGGRDVHRHYRALPRVTVVHPMKWEAYQAFRDLSGRDIGLAPLLDLPFNRGRSCTKFFDITMAGAVGLYAANSECANTVRDGVDGLLVPMRRDQWVAAILELAGNHARRRRMAAAARALLQLGT